MSGPSPAAATAWAWADHLRAGNATPWLEWLPTAAAHDQAAGRGAPPGAAQLEFVRRLAERRAGWGGVANASFATLADLVLARSGPGRGPAYLPLLWPGNEQPGNRLRVGAPPVDPSTIPPGELCRVGAGVLVELLVRAEPNPTEPPRLHRRRPPRRRPWQRAFHLAGAPATVARVRDALAAAGHVEGGRSPEVVLVAEPLDVLLAQIWSARVQSGAPVRWVAFAARWAARDRLPPSANLAEVAAGWAKRVGADRVHVVTGPDPVRQTADLLGVTARPTSASHQLAPAAVDLLRRLNRVLHGRVPQDQIAGHLRRATALLPSAEPADAVLRVPDAQRAWVDARARRITDDLRAGGYAVHGDLDRIAPRHVGAPHPRSADVLDLVLDTCLSAAELTA